MQPQNTIHVPNLPPELLEQIKEVSLLHTLATNARRILPPGKSLLSLLGSRNRRPHDPNLQRKTLKAQVTDVVTRAFWDEALESLSSSTAATQLTRLQVLYEDLYTAVKPLIPSAHPIMYTLSHSLSPTPSPLRSASGHLKTLLSVLRQRCAPTRDAAVDILMDRIDDPPCPNLPQAIVDTVKGIFDLANNMKEDLADYAMGAWTEQEARRWIQREAINRERKVILDVFSAQMIQESYREWLGSDHASNMSSVDRLADRLMRALSSPDPVSPISPSRNLLPPQFLFVASDLVTIQNLLQALVIAACLRSLVRTVDNAARDWLARVWVLLKTEVERGGTAPSDTKLLNLEDEVIRAVGTHDDTTEETLREAVRRTLRTEDPVFLLLQKRLVEAIQERLTQRQQTSLHDRLPLHMRTGRGRPMDEDQEPKAEPDVTVKGFEDEVLKENVKQLAASLKTCLDWMVKGWGELFANV